MNGQGLIGQIVDGRYRIDRAIGKGAMATVYLATDTRFQDRQVVLKFPIRELTGDPTFMRRFVRETQRLIEIDHPNVVNIFDGGEHGGQPYMVMQYLSGGALSDRVSAAGGRLQPGDVLAWFPAVASALDRIHAQGVLHRDIKPANILFDDGGHPYVADFGIAKVLDETDATLTMTATGSLMGSPAYMPPEAGLGERIQPQSDQYSLAAMVYRVLTGRLPHEAPSVAALLVAKTTKDPTPVTDLLPGLPPRAGESIMRALSRNPADRFASCRDLSDAFGIELEGYVGHASLPDSTETPTDKAGSPRSTPRLEGSLLEEMASGTPLDFLLGSLGLRGVLDPAVLAGEPESAGQGGRRTPRRPMSKSIRAAISPVLTAVLSGVSLLVIVAGVYWSWQFFAARTPLLPESGSLEQLVEPPTGAATRRPTAPGSLPPNDPSLASGWVIQVKSTGVLVEARDLQERLSAAGFPSFVSLPAFSTTYSVRVGRYRSQSDAEQVAQALSGRTDIEATWVTSENDPPRSPAQSEANYWDLVGGVGCGNSTDRTCWQHLRDGLTFVLQDDPEPGLKSIRGERKPYLPTYYRGIANYYLGDCEAALADWSLHTDEIEELIDQVARQIVTKGEWSYLSPNDYVRDRLSWWNSRIMTCEARIATEQ